MMQQTSSRSQSGNKSNYKSNNERNSMRTTRTPKVKSLELMFSVALLGLCQGMAHAQGASAAATGMSEVTSTNNASLVGESGWITLFAGQDLSSFDRLGNAQWNLREGAAEADNQLESWLVTRGQYRDFQLRVEFWSSPEANSGVFLRCQDPSAVSATTCYEINVFDQNQNPNNRTGAIINHVPPRVATQAGGRWNTFDITAQGNRITVDLNGTRVAELEDGSFATGPIGLQSNGGLIRFRSVLLKPL
jgi:hypothetical protein